MNKTLKNIVAILLMFLGTSAGYAITEGMTVSTMAFDNKLQCWAVHIGIESPVKAFRAFQCDLAFPSGMTLKAIRFNSKRVPQTEDPFTGEMVRTHQLNQHIQVNGALRMVVTSTENKDILGITGDVLTVYFNDNTSLDKAKSYNVNLTNIELVYKLPNAVKNEKIRQQGLINDVQLRCHDAMCNAASIYGEITQQDLDWTNNFFLHNDNLTSVDVTHCTNAELGTLHIKNPNTLIYARDRAQIGGNQNVVANNKCGLLNLTDKLPYDPIASFSADEIKYTMKMSDAGFSTVTLPFSCAIPQGLEAYQLTVVDDIDYVVKGVVVHQIDAHQPVLLKGNAGEYTFNGTVQSISTTPAVMINGLLVGTYLPMIVAPDNYLLQKQVSGVAFYKVGATTTPGMKPFRAYLATPQVEGKWLTISLQGPTGIQEFGLSSEDATEIFNLGGQRMNKIERGFNIVRQKDGSVRKYMFK